MHKFYPHLDVLPAPRRQLWAELVAVPAEFTLYGGTAIALHLGHRRSVDFDFSGTRSLDLVKLESGLGFLSGARIIQREPNTLSALVEHVSDDDFREALDKAPPMPTRRISAEQPTTHRANR
jgi:Nucleotidyl transferase AbiEii toxin, Type IV TA system